MPVSLPIQTLVVPAAAGLGASQIWDGSWATVVCTGTFDGNTVTLQISYDAGVTWLTAQDSMGANITFAANGHFPQMVYGGNPLVRAKVEGVGIASVLLLKLLYGAALVF